MRKLFRPPSINPQDVAAYVPSAWRDAANELLDHPTNPEHRANLARMLSDSRLRKIWARFDDLVDDRFTSLGVFAGDLATCLEGYRRTLLLLLGTKGGYRSNRTTKQMLASRKSIAGTVDALVKALRDEPDTKAIDIEDVLHWATWKEGSQHQGIPQRHYLGEGDAYVTGPVLIQAGVISPLSRIRLTDVLDALGERLRSGHHLSLFDQITNEPLVQPGRGVQAHLEHSLALNLRILAPLPGDVFAPLIEVALALPKKSVDEGKLEDRFRKIFAPAKKKSSARNRKS
jgi:hypothetical protein